MSRIILIALSITVIIMAMRWWQNKRPFLSKKQLLSLALVILFIVCIILAVTGRTHWLTVVAAGLLAGLQRALPLAFRLFPFLQQLYKSQQAKASQTQQNKASQQGNQSRVKTELLLMTLDHDSGQLDGEILQGDFYGKHLSELDEQQLREFYHYCQSKDHESLQLLKAYLQKRFAGNWQTEENQEKHSQNAQQSTDMSRQEALAVLGLEEGASEADIIQAHRKLMQKMHPDRGGSDYLAAKINAAKSVLLG
jgi:hypothetical protein